MNSANNLIRKCTAHILTILMIVSSICVLAPFYGSLPYSEAYAAGLGAEVKQGDTIELRSRENNWSEEYIILDPNQTTMETDGVLLLLKDAVDLVKYKDPDSNAGTAANDWNSSDARKWCSGYFDSLPAALQNMIIPSYTDEPETAEGNFGISNLNGDKVFFLSESEYDRAKNISEITLGNAWWLRAPFKKNSSITAVVNNNGEVGAAKTESDALARPAFNLGLPEDTCVRKITFDGELSWLIDLDEMNHSYGTAVYSWKNRNEVCTATNTCGYCGKTISETSEARSEKNGSITTYTAEFSDSHFETQTTTADENSFGSGDILRLKSGSWEEEYIILNPTRCNTRSDGMFVLLKDYSGLKTKFNEGIDDYDGYDDLSTENLWEGSQAQGWCTDYYRKLPDDVRGRIIGVRTSETESGYRWHEINNIDGTRGGADADKDKVFFLSSREYLSYRDSADIIMHDSATFGRLNAPTWLLRAPGTDCSIDLKVYVATVINNGETRNMGAGYFDYGARPAFNIDINKNTCADKETDGDFVKWTVDLDNADHEAETPVYEWSEDDMSCTASVKCSRCGRVITEETSRADITVLKEADETSGGEERRTASFENDMFETQSRVVETAAKSEEGGTESGGSSSGEGDEDMPFTAKASDIKPGDHIYIGRRDVTGFTGLPYWRVLDMDSDGNIFLMSEYLWTGNDISDMLCFEPERNPAWQGSNAQKWCNTFYDRILSDIPDVTVNPTTKTDGEWRSDEDAVTFAASENILNGDRVFFLSSEESMNYMPKYGDRVACLHDGSKVDVREGWWLRSPRKLENNSAECVGFVKSNGTPAGAIGRQYVFNCGASRPAMWVSLSSDLRLYKDKNGDWWTGDEAVLARARNAEDKGDGGSGQSGGNTGGGDSGKGTGQGTGGSGSGSGNGSGDTASGGNGTGGPASGSNTGSKASGGTTAGSTHKTARGSNDAGGTKENKAARVKQKGKDGTSLGKGASAEAAEKAILSSGSEEGPKGSRFSKLRLRSLKQGKNNIRLRWNKTKDAVKYVIYGNECGKTRKLKKLAVTRKNSFNVRKISRKLKRGTYHKFMVVALDKNNNVISSSKVIHAATKGGKAGNHKKVTISKKVIARAAKLRKGKTLKLNAKAEAASKKLKVRKHRAVSYESSDPKIASVSRKGVVKARKKGTCYIYAYAQNGVYKKIRVKVK